MKKLIITMLVFVVVAFSGCNIPSQKPLKNKNVSTETTQNEVKEDSTNQGEMPEVEKVDYMQTYSDILDRVYLYITHEIDIFGPDEGLAGIEELVMNVEASENLNYIGFALSDINSDDIPELLIGECEARNPFMLGSNEIFAAYTLVDGEPTFVFDGWSRNRYYLCSNGGFFNEGSGGASYNIKGLYFVGDDGSLDCQGFYFTQPDEFSDKVYFYYNTTGESDTEASEKYSYEAFSEAHPEFLEWCSQVVFAEMTPFSEYTVSDRNSPPSVTVRWANEAEEDISDYKAFYPIESSGSQKVVFYAEEPVMDFKVLSLEMTGFDENYCAVYSIEELYTLDELKASDPLVVGLLDFEYIPRNGFSYVDKHGREWRFSISQSGYDSSMILEQF